MKIKYFVDNMIIYIEKKIVEKFSYDWIILYGQKYEKNNGQSFRYMYSFFYSYIYTKLCIQFYWISGSNVKYINFKCIILAPS